MTAEELLDRFAAVVSESALLKNSCIYLDEFTGFTRRSMRCLENFCALCDMFRLP